MQSYASLHSNAFTNPCEVMMQAKPDTGKIIIPQKSFFYIKLLLINELFNSLL